jgi:hypothetical protein
LGNKEHKITTCLGQTCTIVQSSGKPAQALTNNSSKPEMKTSKVKKQHDNIIIHHLYETDGSKVMLSKVPRTKSIAEGHYNQSRSLLLAQTPPK